MKGFGELIREYREGLRWSQSELARQAGLTTPSAVRRAEEGAGSSSVETVQAIIEALMEPCQLGGRELQELAAAYVLTEEQRRRTGGRGVIGLLVSNVGLSRFWGRVAGAIEDIARGNGVRVVLCQHGNEIDRHLEALRFFDRLPGILGVISGPAYGPVKYSAAQLQDLDEALDALLEHRIPVVFIERDVPTTTRVPFIGIDNGRAVAKAVERLWADGHRRIGGLFDVPEVLSPQAERRDSFCKELKRRGVYDEALIACTDPWIGYRPPGQRGGLRTAGELLAKRPTAVFAANYHLTLNVVEAARDLKLAIPGDVSVVGFDSLPELEMAGPGITTVHFDVGELGLRAYTKLVEYIDAPDRIASLKSDGGGTRARIHVYSTIAIAERNSVARVPLTTPAGAAVPD